MSCGQCADQARKAVAPGVPPGMATAAGPPVTYGIPLELLQALQEHRPIGPEGLAWLAEHPDFPVPGVIFFRVQDARGALTIRYGTCIWRLPEPDYAPGYFEVWVESAVPGRVTLPVGQLARECPAWKDMLRPSAAVHQYVHTEQLRNDLRPFLEEASRHASMNDWQHSLGEAISEDYPAYRVANERMRSRRRREREAGERQMAKAKQRLVDAACAALGLGGQTEAGQILSAVVERAFTPPTFNDPLPSPDEMGKRVIVKVMTQLALVVAKGGDRV
jgi:hypothetical protein